MSTKAAAVIDNMEDLLDIEVDLEGDVYGGEVMVGGHIEGDMYLVTHECPTCHSKMETIGVGYSKYFCGHCKAQRNYEVEMNTRFTKLEILQ